MSRTTALTSPSSTSLKSGEPEISDWQIKLDAWVAVCDDFIKLRERMFMSGFRGFRYFDVPEYRGHLTLRIPESVALNVYERRTRG